MTMKRLYIVLSTALLMMSLSVKADTVTITQEGNSFAPVAIQVNVGDVIHFVWTGGSHNTTSVTVPGGADTWAAPLNMSNPTFDYTVEVAGIYAYVCTFHNGMGGGFEALPANNIEANITSAPEFVAGMDGTGKVLYVNLENYNPTLTTIRLIDITGREVEVLLNAEVNLGAQSYRFDMSGRPRGMYFVRLEQAGKVVTRKVMLN